MSDDTLPKDLMRVPAPAIGRPRRWTFSLVWIVPLVALLIGLSLVVQAIRQQGPTITVQFSTAEGIEPGKTKVKFKAVDIGEVKKVQLAEDRTHVMVTIDLVKEADRFAVADSRFWVVRPRLAGTRVSGLATLLSGAYIGVDGGRSNESRSDFMGLEEPPVVPSDVPGRRFTLHAADIGSLDAGSPVYFRRVLVGHVESFALGAEGRDITLQVWVNSPYDHFVTADTRFWHASGVDLKVDAEGVKLETQSLATILMGGIAFETPQGTANAEAAKEDAEFTLAGDRGQAMKRPDGAPQTMVLRFRQSVRGLAVGAPVDFRGVELGYVKSIGVVYDAKTHDFTSPVVVDVYPDRLDAAGAILPGGGDDHQRRLEVLGELVERGLRAQLRTGNLLAGQLYVALDFFPTAPAARLDQHATPLELPTVPSDLEELHQQVASILAKLNQVPFDTLGQDLHRTLVSLDATIQHFDTVATRANGDLLPEIRTLLQQTERTLEATQASLAGLAPDAPLQQDTRQALRGVAEATRSLKALADSLDRHPESLVRGRKSEEQ